MIKILLALMLAGVGAWAGSHLAYMRHNPLYKHDPANGTFMEPTPDNNWRWWVGIFVGGFIGAASPYANEPFRAGQKPKK